MKWQVHDLKHRFQQLIPICKSVARTSHFWFVLVLVILGGFVLYQQVQINDLTERLNAQEDVYDKHSFDYRITNLEHRSNAQGDHLQDIDNTLWQLQTQNRQFDWEIKQLEWLHPELAVDHTPPITTYENPTQK